VNRRTSRKVEVKTAALNRPNVRAAGTSDVQMGLFQRTNSPAPSEANP